MSYKRFLNNNDYLSIITEQALHQLVRDNENRYAQAEEVAEATIMDYLGELYEVEREFNVGKNIIPYNRQMTYPVGAHFYWTDEDGKTNIYVATKAINGYHAPSQVEYWKEYEGNIDECTVDKYSQLKTYHVGDVVVYNRCVYECIADNGYMFDDIRIPNVIGWKEAKVYNWDAAEFNQWDVVKYEGNFYTLMTLEDYDELVNPYESDNWGKIGNYDKSLDTYELSTHEYVVLEGKVYYPIINVNADTPEVGVNIGLEDPRNFNLKRHMVQLAMYELHKLISPVNISNVRISDFENTMQWLRDASKLKLNPHIPRRIGHDRKPITDWATATFQRGFNPYEDPWLV